MSNSKRQALPPVEKKCPTALEFVPDEIIKKRLMVDADGMGDDRRYASLNKALIEFVNSSSDEEWETNHRGISLMLLQTKHTALKTVGCIKAQVRNKKSYIELKENIGNKTNQARENIIKLKGQLDLARKHRRHIIEYDALAKLIETQTDRKESEDYLNELATEVQSLESYKTTLDIGLEERKRNLSILSSSLENLKAMLNDTQESHAKKHKGEPAEKMEESGPSRTLTPCPMEEDEVPVQGQITDSKNISGVVTSAPVSPLVKDKERYEDLSDSGDET